MLNLVGEVGEFAGKVAKGIRKGAAVIAAGQDLYFNGEKHDFMEASDALKKEAGDILWQLSGLCKVMGWSLEDVAQMNLDKLAARKAAGTIDGSGDGITPEERGVKEVKEEVKPVKAAPTKPRKPSNRKGYKKTKGLEVLPSLPDKRLYKDRQALTKAGIDINAIYQGEKDMKIRGYKYGHKVYYAYGDYIRLKNRLTGRLF